MIQIKYENETTCASNTNALRTDSLYWMTSSIKAHYLPISDSNGQANQK